MFLIRQSVSGRIVWYFRIFRFCHRFVAILVYLWNDRVTYLEPDQSEYEELLDCCIKADHWDDEKTDKEIEELERIIREQKG